MITKRAFLFLSIVMSVSVYANSFQNGFSLDDWSFIVDNTFIKDWRNILVFFGKGYFKLAPGEIDLQRPLMTLLFMAEYQIWGLNPLGYHITSIFIHTLNSVAVFYLIFRLTHGNYLKAVITSLIFAVHPIHTEAVNAINFREDILVTLFYLTSILLFLKGLQSAMKGALFVMAVCTYIFALMSKEMALTLPIMIFLIHRCMLRSVSEVFKEKWFYACLFAVTFLYITFLTLLDFPLNKGIPESPGIFRYSLSLPMIIGVISDYLRLLLFPINLNVLYDFPRYVSLLLPGAAISGILLILLVLLGFHQMRRNPVIGLFVLWFFVTIIPVSNIIPIYDAVAERYLYLPSIGPIALLSGSITYLEHYKRGCAAFLLVLLLCLYSTLTIEKNKDWKDDYSLWKNAVKKMPLSPLSHKSMGRAAYKKGMFDEAISELKEAEKLKSNSAILADIYYSMGLVYTAKGMYEDANNVYSKAVGLNPSAPNAYYALGTNLMREGRDIEAIDAFGKVLNIEPMNGITHYQLGVIYNKLGDLQRAAEEYMAALKTLPVEAGVNLGTIYAEKGDYKGAINEFKKALNADPSSIKARMNLGIVYMKSGDDTSAKREFQEVLKLDPKNTLAYSYLNRTTK